MLTMHVSRLRIVGFRGIQAADVRLGPNTVLVGPNGCGKTTIGDALSLVLGRPRMVRALTEHDFAGSTPVAATRIRIIATVTGFATDDPADHPHWFQFGRAVPKWFAPDLQEHAVAGEGRKLCANIGFAARFDPDDLEVVTVRYFHDDDDAEDPFRDEDGRVTVPQTLLNELGFYVLPARRGWEAVASFNSDLFRRMVAHDAGIPADEIIQLRNQLRSPPTKIEESPKLERLVRSINETLSRLVLGAPTFQLRVTAGDTESLLQALQPHYTTTGGGSLPVSRHGAGLLSLQNLLLLLELGRSRKQRGLPFLLLLEEPELHLAPGIQSRLVADALHVADQVVCTTHSPEVARLFDATATVILSNRGGMVGSAPLLARPLPPEASNNERKLFIQNRARVVAALMHPYVLIPEGRFDSEWLVRLGQIADQHASRAAPFSTVFGVVPTENAAVTFTAEKLSHVHSRIVVLVDGDSAGDSYAAEAARSTSPPHAIVQWPNEWTVEDIVCWALEAGGDEALSEIQKVLTGIPVGSVAELRSLLKQKNDAKNGVSGLKEDVVAHEAIAGVLESNVRCRERVVAVCESLVCAGLGLKDDHIAQQQTPHVFRFVT